MKKTIWRCPAALFGAILFLLVTPAFASVAITGTRVVFPAKYREVTVHMTSNNNGPVLIETWIDDGDPNSAPDKSHTPFLVTPPLFRLDAHKEQAVRVLATDNELPSDRESLFYFNVLEIPPKPTSLEYAGKNVLQLAIRSRLKLFYRPQGLAGDPLTAASKLQWKVVASAGGFALQMHNPTAYYITVAKAAMATGGATLVGDTAAMVAPMSDARMEIKDLTRPLAGATKINFEIINDFGSTTPFVGDVVP
jgi:P pilus assembly chaperone PapD